MTSDQNNGKPITVAIVDDQKVLVEALKLIIGREPGFQVAGESRTGRGCLELVERIHPDVLLLEMRLPDGDGLDLLSKISRASPDTRVIVLSAHCDEVTLIRAVDGGASGYLSKDQSLTEVLNAIRAAARGEKAIPVDMLLDLIRRRIPASALPARQDDGADHQKLTRREREILVCLAQGKSGEEIAAQLELSPQTVRTFIRNLMEKLHVHSRMEAVSYALRNGIIQLPE